MKQTFLIQKQHPRLLIFFAGWGADANLFRNYLPEDCDYLLCYDYRSMYFDASLLKPYRKIHLVAWSMGVWAASQVLSGLDLPFEERIAVNGTPFPVDDHRGIPKALFQATLDNFGPTTLQRFRRRICGSADNVRAFLAHDPLRSLAELKDELEALSRSVTSHPSAPFAWDKAIIGSRDKIFPPANQLRAWEGTETIICDEEHYSEQLFKELLGDNTSI